MRLFLFWFFGKGLSVNKRFMIIVPVVTFTVSLVMGLILVSAQGESVLPDVVIAERSSFHPEGIEFDPETGQFLTGSFTEGTVFTIDDTGAVAEFITDSDFVSTIGIHIDHDNNRLLVANADPGIVADPEATGIAMLGIYDLSTGERMHMVDLGALLPDSVHFANDVVNDADGNAYVTDSFTPVIYRVTPDGTASIFAEDKRFANESWGLNGIEYHPDGYLLVAVTGAGALYKLPIGDPESITAVALPEPIGADGMVFDPDGRLIVVATTFETDGMEKSEVLALSSEDAWESASIVGRAPTDAARSPTTATIRDGAVYVVYAHFDAMFAGEPVESFEIERVSFN